MKQQKIKTKASKATILSVGYELSMTEIYIPVIY